MSLSSSAGAGAALAPASPVVELRNLSKGFPGVKALSNVTLTLHTGEVHALLGENGAGKSTLIKILTGTYRADEGGVLMNGELVDLSDPHHAQAAGIALVPQDVLVVPQLSIGRNIMLGRESAFTRRGALTATERDLTSRALARVGANFSPDVIASTLSVPQLRLAQISRALVTDCAVLVLDEPTAALNEHDAENLLERVNDARNSGKAILYVTHRLSEVMLLADRVSVLRDGELVGSFVRGSFDRATIVDLLTKTEHRPRAHIGDQPDLDAALGTIRLRANNISDGERLHGIDLEVRAGQILGIAGVQGSGHGHLVKVIAGLAPATGTIEIDEKPMPLARPGAAFSRGVILVPADRRNAAIVGPMSILSNLAISRRIRRDARRFGLRWPGKEKTIAREHVARLSIKAPSVRTQVGLLSGGNQQKVALSRALEGNAHVLLVEEPTQGIDIDAKAEVAQLLKEFAAAGGSVIVATSEFEELIDLADEAIVLCQGKVSGRLSRQDITYRNILNYALA